MTRAAPSLTLRLTLLFASVSGAVLLALGTLVASAIERHFDELDQDALLERQAQVQHWVQTALAQSGTTAPLDWAALLQARTTQPLQLRDAAGRLLLAISPEAFPPEWPLHTVAEQAQHVTHWHSEGGHYRVLAGSIDLPAVQGGPLHLALALHTGHHASFMRSLQATLWWFVAGAAVLTGLLGAWAARQGLAPLRAMRERAAAVTAHRLDERLPDQSVPRELAELAHTLNAMLERLQAAFVRLSDFSVDIAHELRTPVSNLMTQTQVALSRARTGDDYRAALESNAEELERLARMIADMLLLAQAEHGLAESLRQRPLEPIDLEQEVGELLDFYDALAEARGLQLRFDGQARLPAERTLLRRAISNLLSNALRHAEAGSTVWVHLSEDAHTVHIGVENAGAPIAPEHQARLFERFYRADPARPAHEGTGLGLAITQAIARAHGGDITVACAGGWTRFTLALPKVHQPARPAAPENP